MYCPKCGHNNNQSAKFCVNCGSPIEQPLYTQTDLSSLVSVPVNYAGFWMRFLALIIDAILCQVASIFIVLPLAFTLGFSMAETSTLDEIELAGEALGSALGVIIQWLWFTIPESSKWQASIGKKLLGLKVMDENGERISFGRANGRYWSKILSAFILCIGFLMAGFTKKKQGLHDIIAGTLVVKS